MASIPSLRIVDQMCVVSSSYFISVSIFFSYLPLPENGSVLIVSIDFFYLVDILILCIRMEVYFGGKKKLKKTTLLKLISTTFFWWCDRRWKQGMKMCY